MVQKSSRSNSRTGVEARQPETTLQALLLHTSNSFFGALQRCTILRGVPPHPHPSEGAGQHYHHHIATIVNLLIPLFQRFIKSKKTNTS